MKPAVRAAVDLIMKELGAYETRAMSGAPAAHAEPDGDEAPGMGAEDCPECAAGTCDNPDHMDEGSRSAMLKDLGA